MIVAAAVLAVVLGNSTERDVLISRWTHATRATIPVDRRLHAGAAPSQAALAPLERMAAAELSVPGRYQLRAVASAPPQPKSWWERLLSWLGDRWNALIRALFGRAHIDPKAAAFIGDLIIALLVLAVAGAAIRLLVVYGRRGRRASSVRGLTPAADAATLYAMACERADRCEYAGAGRLLFRATLALLDVRGAVRDDASATVGEIRRRLPASDGTSAFDAVAAMFVAGTYAERPLDAAEWQRAREAYLSLAREPAA